jgi:hypothetical protein
MTQYWNHPEGKKRAAWWKRAAAVRRLLAAGAEGPRLERAIAEAREAAYRACRAHGSRHAEARALHRARAEAWLGASDAEVIAACLEAPGDFMANRRGGVSSRARQEPNAASGETKPPPDSPANTDSRQ